VLVKTTLVIVGENLGPIKMTRALEVKVKVHDIVFFKKLLNEYVV
jgi:BRCT domain type II-containing protein